MLKKRKPKQFIKHVVKKQKVKPPFLSFLKNLSFKTTLLFVIGLFLVIVPLFYYFNETIQLAFFTPHVPIIAKKFTPPTHIAIDALYLDSPIEEEGIFHGVWGIATNGISHLNISARPGETGSIILYGHNTNDRLGSIRWIKIGTEIVITTSDRKKHKYAVTKTEDVFPSQTNLLTNVKEETLILYTCDGFADLQRFLVFAKPG